MALIAIDGAASFAIDDVTGKLHVVDLSNSSIAEIDFNVMATGGITFKGGYDAATDTPSLDDGTPIAIAKGDMYVVTVAGNFFTEAVQIGDSLIANIDSALVLADWTRLEGNAQPVVKTHVITDGTTWQAAWQDAIDNPGVQLHVLKVQASFDVTSGNQPSGTVTSPVHVIADTSTLAARPVLTDKNHVIVTNSNVDWDGVDIDQDVSNTNVFFVVPTDSKARVSMRKCDIKRSSDEAFIECSNDSYLSVEFVNCTGVSTSTTKGLVHANNNGAGAPITLIDAVFIGCNFSGVMADTSDATGVEEINVAVFDSIFKNNGSGVWNKLAGTVLNVKQTVSSQVARDLVGGSSAPTFSVLGTPEDWSFFISDQDSDLTVTTAITFTATKKRRLLTGDIPSVTVKTAPTGSTATFDILVGGVSVFSTVISIDAGQKTSVTAATPAVLDATKTLIDVGDLVEFKILTVGTTIKGTGAKLNIPNLIEA